MLEGMSHMQRTGNIGRRQHDAVGICSLMVGWAEIAGRLPSRIPAGFYLFWIKAFCKFHDDQVIEEMLKKSARQDVEGSCLSEFPKANR